MTDVLPRLAPPTIRLLALVLVMLPELGVVVLLELLALALTSTGLAVTIPEYSATASVQRDAPALNVTVVLPPAT